MWSALSVGLTLIPIALAAEKLLMTAVVHRHGDRSPTTCFPVEENGNQCARQWTQGFGQLSAKGMKMGGNLGSLLRQRYVDEYGIVRPNYTRIDTIVRSTDYDRTLQTSESVLQQLFPPGSGPEGGLTDQRLQVVPEHTVATGNDRLLRAWASSTCARFADAGTQEQKQHAAAWAEQDEKLAPLREGLSRATGLPASALTVGGIYVVADTALCNMDHGYPLPAGFTPEMYNVTKEVGDWSLSHLFNTTLQQQLSAGRLVGELLARAQAAKDGTPQPGFDPSSFAPNASDVDPRVATGPRLALYSAHDATLVALLQALGAYDGLHPPYASSVALELWSTDVAATEGLAPGLRAQGRALVGAEAPAGSRMERLMRAAGGEPLAALLPESEAAMGLAASPTVSAGAYHFLRIYYNARSGEGLGFRQEDLVVPRGCEGQPGNTPGVPADASCSLDGLVQATRAVAVDSDAQAEALCAHPPAPRSDALTARSFDFTALAVSCAVSLILGAVIMGAILPACGCRCPRQPSEEEKMAASFGGGAYASMGH